MRNPITSPIIYHEEITVAANAVYQRSTSGSWENSTADKVLIDRILFDMNSNNFQIRFGIRGRTAIIDDYLSPDVLHNVLMQDRAVDNAFPLLKLRRDHPYRVARYQDVAVRLEDELNAADRIINVIFSGIDSNGNWTAIGDRVTVPQNGSINAYPRAREYEYLDVFDISLYEESTGEAGDLRNLKLNIKQGGNEDWSTDSFRASIFFADRNGDARVVKPEGPMILDPGDVLDIEIQDIAKGGGTVYIGAIGYRYDRRMGV